MLIKINAQDPEPEKITQVVAVLKSGGVIVYPTDTIYGLGCDIFNKQAVNKIYQIKKRDSKKPLSIICDDFKDASQYVLIQDYAFRLMKAVLPGPYTFILKAKAKLPNQFLAKNKTIGIRIPNNNICLEIVKALGNPIISTSLNISGEEVLTEPNQLSKEMRNKVDLIIEAGKLPQTPSSIIDLSGDQPVIVRPGQGDLTLFNQFI